MENIFRENTESEKVMGKIVEGNIPNWLHGTLVRSGPGKWQLDETFSLNHFLDGCAMMVRFEINPKKNIVYASSKFLKSDAYKKMCDQKRPVYTEFGTPAFSDTSKSLFTRVLNKVVPSDLTDNDISNIYKVNDEVYLTTESCNIWKIDPENLESLMKVNLDKKAGIAISCSHPLYCKKENALYNVGSTFLTGMKYHLMKVDLGAKIEKQKTSFDNSKIVCSFNSSYKACLAYNHSFAMTENYVIVIEQSLLVNGLKLATCTPKGKSLADCLEWYPDEPTHFHVIDKRTNQLLKHKFQSKSFFFFHTINAYQENDKLVVDVLTYEENELLEALKMKNLKAGKFDSKVKSVPTRFILPIGDLKTMKKEENLANFKDCKSILNEKGIIKLEGYPLGPCGLEMPTINPDFMGKPYNFVYGTGFLEKNVVYENAIGKIDLEKNSAITYKHSNTSYPGEGVFVKSPNSTEEDDGLIITVAAETDLNKNSFLAILDAKTLNLLCKVEFDREEITLAPTLHGIYLPAEDDLKDN